MTASPSLPIPNSDPACYCALAGNGTAHKGVVHEGDSPGPLQARVSLRADCPHHGFIVRAFQGVRVTDRAGP